MAGRHQHRRTKMKKTILAVVVTMSIVGNAFATNQDHAKRLFAKYPYKIKTECRSANTSSIGVAPYTNYVGALKCAEDVTQALKDEEDRQARLELMRALTKRLKRTEQW